MNTANTGYQAMSGTSMATPLVSSLVAQYLQYAPTSTPAQVKTFLTSQAWKNLVKSPGTNSPNLLSRVVVAAAAPTRAPTRRPTKAPTRRPTKAPTRRPTKAPTRPPSTTRAPTRRPTRRPTGRPTRAPTRRPTKAPTKAPTSTTTPNSYWVCIGYDDYPSETTWYVQDTVSLSKILSGNGSGVWARTEWCYQLPTLTVGRKYKLVLKDSYGDGSCCMNGYGYGAVSVFQGSTWIKDLLFQYGQFTSSVTYTFTP